MNSIVITTDAEYAEDVFDFVRNEIDNSDLDMEGHTITIEMMDVARLRQDCAALRSALDRLLTCTLDLNLSQGVCLTEEEQGARAQALAVFARLDK